MRLQAVGLTDHSLQVRTIHRFGAAVAVATSLCASMQARAAGPSDCSALLADASRVGMIRNTTITSATYATTVAGARELIRLICCP
jgi:hypothetical protein